MFHNVNSGQPQRSLNHSGIFMCRRRTQLQLESLMKLVNKSKTWGKLIIRGRQKVRLSANDNTETKCTNTSKRLVKSGAKTLSITSQSSFVRVCVYIGSMCDWDQVFLISIRVSKNMQLRRGVWDCSLWQPGLYDACSLGGGVLNGFQRGCDWLTDWLCGVIAKAIELNDGVK